MIEVNKKKVLVVFGTRPEAIKMAPVIRELSRHPETFVARVCVSGQHREMLKQVNDIFEIIPDDDLEVMKTSQDLVDITCSVILGLRGVIRGFCPDVVLVHGDTTTAMAGALSAFYHRVPVAHVEAGLRTHDLSAPYPEEANRQIISRIASCHFAPTESAVDNLLREGVRREAIHLTGNTVIDALHWILKKLERVDAHSEAVRKRLFDVLRFNWADEEFVLITGHRRENFGAGLRGICDAIAKLSSRFPGVRFVYPVHLNPNVRGSVMNLLRGRDNVHLIDPLDYESFALLMQACRLVLTDSGGIQEEAPSLGKRVFVMRETTERPEAVRSGTATLVGSDSTRIFDAVAQCLSVDGDDVESLVRRNPYGDGRASQRIVNILKESK